MAHPRLSTGSVPARRITLLALFPGVIGAALLLRLFQLQVIQHEAYSEVADKRQQISTELAPKRGGIFVREGSTLFPLAANREYFLVHADPRRITSPNAVIDAITPILGLTEPEWKELLGRLANHADPYEPIKHKVTKEQVEAIKAKELAGIGFTPEPYRSYPESGIGGHVIGFVSQAGKGQYGLEGYFHDVLSGKHGFLQGVRDALGAVMTVGPRVVEQATDGADILVSLDRQVQFTACKKLAEYGKRLQARQGSVVIQDPKTGAVLAMCGYPDFNPGEYETVADINQFNNPAIFYAYEPGSVFKPLTMAAALDQGKIEPQTIYEDKGELVVAGFHIKNFDKKARGRQTMVQVLENSLNTGAMFAADKIGRQTFADYVEKFGFGKAAGITLDTEAAGDVSSLAKPGEIFYLTASFGQGITVTPLQLAAAFSAVANGGTLMKPYIVSEVRHADGSSETTKPQEVRRVISQRAARLLSGMMVSVVEKGYDKKARVPGYYLAGKTGTAQVAKRGGGYGDETIHSFVGFGPASDPRFTIVLRVDNPQGVAFAADSLSPLFRELSDFLIKHFEIPPEY